jgi:hypothetical protein
LQKEAHEFLAACHWLAMKLTAQPTKIYEIIPQLPTFVGACNVSGQGMGGVWIQVRDYEPPIMWWCHFLSEITTALVSSDNPEGTIINSDLELLGATSHQALLAHEREVSAMTNTLLSDNTTTVHWLRRASATTTKAPVYLLQALLQWHYGFFTTYEYIPGKVNTMADECSCCWDLADAQLLTHFNLHYPQCHGWQLCHLQPAMHSMLISALNWQWPMLELYLAEPRW